jgi:hypothetical protein
MGELVREETPVDAAMLDILTVQSEQEEQAETEG